MSISTPPKTVVAYHEVRAGISIYLRLSIHSLDDASGAMVFTVGMRAPNDTLLPPGSRLMLKESDLKLNDSKRLYYIRVDRMQRQGDQQLHTGRITESIEPFYHRQHPRVNMNLEVCRNSQLRFQTLNISHGGLQLCYTATLTSALLYQRMPLFLSINQQFVRFDCRPKYIIYNWWEQRHLIGVEFVDVTADQRRVLEGLLGPFNAEEPTESNTAGLSELLNFIDRTTEATPPAAAQSTTPDNENDPSSTSPKTLIDPESGRIRFDRL